MAGQSFLMELHRLDDSRFMAELEMLIGPNASLEGLRNGAETAARAYPREHRQNCEYD